MSLEDQLLNVMVDLQEEPSYDVIRKMLEEGTDPKKIIEILRKGVEVVGEKFVKKE
jgi:methanogenic corrinoid protein MtbC1